MGSVNFSQLRLKPLTSADLQAVVALDQICLGGLWTLEGYQRELDSPNSQILVLSTPQRRENGDVLITEPQDKIIGIGCFWSILEEAHITILAVHPDYQGRGLGQFMLYSLLHDAVKWGLERATLEVRQSNQVALAIYQKFGFQIAGLRKKYYQDPQEDAMVLWLGGLNKPDFQQCLISWQQHLHERLRSNHWHLK